MNTKHKYFPVNDAQRQWGLYATCVGHSQTNPGDDYPSSVHPDEYFFSWEQGRVLHEWQLILLTQGRGTVEFRNRRHSAKEGSLIILPPESWHRYRPNKKTGWTTFWIGFGGDLAARLVGGAGFNPEGEVRNISHAKHFHRLLSETVANILEHGLDNIYSAAARIPMLVAALIEEQYPDAEDISRTAFIRRAQSHISAHATEVVDFEELAKSLNMPYRTFRYVFSKETGTSPLQYQLDIRLARAKNLLRSTEMPIAEIAGTLGFNSTWYFAHFFQKHVQISASDYRKKHRLSVGQIAPARM